MAQLPAKTVKSTAIEATAQVASSVATGVSKTVYRVDIPSLPTKPAKTRTAAYARVSSGKDAMLHSLSAQISHYNRLIQGNPAWEFVGIYADEALTGTKDNRAEFQRLIADCRDGKIDLIITKSVTRFARNTVTTIETVRELRLLDIDVYFEKENIHSIDASGELMLTILASYAQEESRSASENCKWRIRKMFEAGRPNTGRMLGYKLVEDKLEIIPAEAEIVRQIFSWYLSGMGVTAIMRQLMTDEVLTLHGGEWREITIHDILRNEKYTGSMVLQKTYRENHLTKRKLDNHGELPMYHVENSHEAIIDEITFAKAQAEIARRQTAVRTKSTPPKFNTFSGLVKCDSCGKSYRRRIASSGSKYAKPVWICSTYNRLGKSACASKRISEGILLKLTCQVLGMKTEADVHNEDFANAIYVLIDQIIVRPENTLVYVLKSGRLVTVKWDNPSRRDSWTPSMKEAARQKKLAYHQKRAEAKATGDHDE